MGTHEDNLINMICEMSEEEAKATLAEIFLNMSRVNGVNYKTTTCYEDIERIFKRKVVDGMIRSK